jgi:hypothetical protein
MTDRWSPTSPFGTQRARHTATLLGDGRVAIAGGTTNGSERAYLNTVELFESGEGRWSPVPGGFGEARAGHAAALLPDGHLLIAGGASNFEGELRSVEFDLASGAQRFSVPLTTARVRPQAVVLPDGGVVLIGGTSTGVPPNAVETYDLARRSWIGAAPLLTARVDFAAVALPGGELFVSGGVADGAPTRSAERYRPVATPERCFAETGYCVRGPFAAYWEAHGGLALNGYPLSAERVETLEDGQPYSVQYFERTRLEYHPTNPAPYTVLLGQFGRRVLATGAARGQLARVDPLPDATYFTETGHNARGRFLDYWQAHGGLAQFGFPVSEEFIETLEDGQPYTVQYFERARFEYHPENVGTPYEVLLGQFGRAIMEQSALLTGAFGYLYLVNEEVRGRLGLPLGPAATVNGATLEFERGRMYYRADQRRIYVLGNLRGDLLGPPGAGASFPDTGREGEPVGGGPGPIAGTFAPRFGFGKVWRENGYLRERLGYALAAEETSYPLVAQEFARGVLFLSPDGEIVTALYLSEPQPCTPGYNCAPESQGSFQCYRAFNRVQQCGFPVGTPPRVVTAR